MRKTWTRILVVAYSVSSTSFQSLLVMSSTSIFIISHCSMMSSLQFSLCSFYFLVIKYEKKSRLNLAIFMNPKNANIMTIAGMFRMPTSTFLRSKLSPEKGQVLYTWTDCSCYDVPPSSLSIEACLLFNKVIEGLSVSYHIKVEPLSRNHFPSRHVLTILLDSNQDQTKRKHVYLPRMALRE